jgi:hypothetical protein
MGAVHPGNGSGRAEATKVAAIAALSTLHLMFPPHPPRGVVALYSA